MAAVFGLGGVLTVVQLGHQLSEPAVRDRGGVILSLVAAVLRPLGLGVVLVSQAITFTDVTTYFRPFQPPTGTPRSWRLRRRIRQQIAGKVPHAPAEVTLLRSVAGWMLSLRNSAAANAGLLVFSLGVALAPLSLSEPSARVGLDAISGRAFQVLGGLLSLVLTVALVRSRSQFSAAERFLVETERHGPVPPAIPKR